MKILQYLYYRFFQLMVSVGNGDVAEIFSIILMTTLLGINFIAFSSLYYFFTGLKFILVPDSNLLSICLILGVIIILYILLVIKGKSVKIIKKFEDESEKEKTKGRVVVVLYIVLSFLLLIFSFYLMLKKNRGEL